MVRAINRRVGFSVLVLMLLLASTVARAQEQPPTERQGDWTVAGQETIQGQRIRLDGNLILPEGATLTLENCTLEIVGEYSRAHTVEWQGGTLVTRNCTVGGFVNDSGTAIHTVFHLYAGLWEATDTIVQYSYGVSFHWQEGRGVLRGERFIAGPRPDAIILSGQADVRLVDSSFPIGLGVVVDRGGSCVLDLTPGKRDQAVYDRANLLPGVDWRLELVNTEVERWFLFVRNIGMSSPPAQITLEGSRELIVSLLGHNLRGRITLTPDLHAPLEIGNAVLKTTGGPAGISMYAVYCSGSETDLTVTGAAHICELMHRGGRLRLEATPGKNELSIGCTTLEVAGDARLELSHVHLGRPQQWQAEASIGEANIAENGQLSGTGVSIRDVRFRTTELGRVDLDHVERQGRVEKAGVHEAIRIDPPAAKAP